jgi:hypothetical protein
MQIAELDASGWLNAIDVCNAIYEALGSQYDSSNINALMEGLYWDHAYDDLNNTGYCATYTLKPPFKIVIRNAPKAPQPVVEWLNLIQECLVDAHKEFREMYEGRDVVIEFEIA